MRSLEAIVCPTDFSDSSAPAFAYACDLAAENRARLIVVHVMEPVAPVVVDGIALPIDVEPLRKAAQEKLAALRPTDASILYESVLREGPAAATIAELAEQREADLIVMGTHGRGGLSRLLMGSVAEHVLRKATCPVLFVKTFRHAPVVEESTDRRRAADQFAGV